MRTKHPLLIIVAAIILAPGMFPLQGFSQAPFYQKADGTTKFDIPRAGKR